MHQTVKTQRPDEIFGRDTECGRLAKAENEAGTAVFGAPSDAATERLAKIETRIAETPTTTILGIVTKLRTEASLEVDYDFWATEHTIKTALAGAEHLLARSQGADAGLLALEAEINAEYATWKAGTFTDDESDEYGERVAEMEQRFAKMPAHTLSGVAAKLRHLRRLLVDDGTLCTHDIPLVETSLAAVEQTNKAELSSARR